MQASSSSNTGTEGTSTYSNSEGELLFYTNSNKVWNKFDNIMPNGNLGGILGTHSQVIIVPKPLSTDNYYIFTTQRQDLPSNRKLQYHEVDMSLNSGNGDVTNKNIELYTLPTTEQIAATYHSNGTDIWVVTHEYGTNNFLAFLITNSGINLTPIISSVGSSHTPCSGNSNTRGNTKFSPDGTKIAFNGNGENGVDSTNILELFNFDNSTGVITNPLYLPFLGDEFGLSFSPDNSKLYCTTWSTGSITAADSNYLYQFDIAIYDSLSIANSRTILHSGYALDNQFGTIKIGPDGKLYVAKHDQQYLGVINNPNEPGLACNYMNQGLLLNGTCNFGLNNYIEYSSYCDTSSSVELDQEFLARIYPNPTSEVLFISGISQPFDLKITDCQGKILYEENSILNGKKSIDVRHFSNGLLILEIRSKDDTMHHQIIKV